MILGFIIMPRKKILRNLVGPAIRQFRYSQRPPMSQEDLSGRLAGKGLLLDRSGVSRTENQKRIVSDFELLFFCKVFGKDPNDFYDQTREADFQKIIQQFEEESLLELKVAEDRKKT